MTLPTPTDVQVWQGQSAVTGFELAAIDGAACCREKAHFTAELDQARERLGDRPPIAKIGNCLVIES